MTFRPTTKHGCYRNKWKRHSEIAEVKAWRSFRFPFALPIDSIGHECKWEKLDIDLCGCVNCGKIHKCDVRTCPIIENNDHITCSLTGFCVRENVFATSEYCDNVTIQSMGSPQKTTIDATEVYPHIHKLLFSPNTEASHITEMNKIQSKYKSILMRVLKEFKTKNPGRAPNLCHILTTIMQNSKNNRFYNFLPEPRDLERIAQTCSQCIAHVISLMKRHDPKILNSTKFSTLCIGMLYLMRNGLETRSVMVMPYMKILTYILPMETHLHSNFNIRCKSITEIENIVKIFLRNLPSQYLMPYSNQAVDYVLFKPTKAQDNSMSH